MGGGGDWVGVGVGSARDLGESARCKMVATHQRRATRLYEVCTLVAVVGFGAVGRDSRECGRWKTSGRFRYRLAVC